MKKKEYFLGRQEIISPKHENNNTIAQSFTAYLWVICEFFVLFDISLLGGIAKGKK